MIASLSDEVWRAISTEPWSFVLGAVVGFLGNNRYQVIRRDRGGADAER